MKKNKLKFLRKALLMIILGSIGIAAAYLIKLNLLQTSEPLLADYKSFNEGLAAVLIDKKWGFINRCGEVVIKPKFDAVDSFNEDLATIAVGHVLVNKKYGFIDKSGQIVIQPRFALASDFSDGLALFSGENKSFVADHFDLKFGYIDKSGKVVIEPKFNLASDFSNGLAVAEIEKKFGFIDKSGAFVIQPGFAIAEPFSEDLAVVGVYMNEKIKLGFINKSGQIVISPQFDEAKSFSDGMAPVKIGGQWGYINKDGQMLITPQFVNASPFSEGLAAVELGSIATGYEKIYINKQGQKAFQTKSLTFNAPFNEGIALIGEGHRYGYIDRAGKIVIQPQFIQAYSFKEGFARTLPENGGQKGFINQSGQMLKISLSNFTTPSWLKKLFGNQC